MTVLNADFRELTHKGPFTKEEEGPGSPLARPRSTDPQPLAVELAVLRRRTKAGTLTRFYRSLRQVEVDNNLI